MNYLILAKQPMYVLTCYICGGNKTQKRKSPMKQWRCRKCYIKYIVNPKKPRGYWKKYERSEQKMKEKNHRIMLFKDRRIYLKENPRKGQCTVCGLKIGDKYINKHGKEVTIKHTQIHHLDYHYDDPLKDAIEVCVKCHREKHISINRS